MAARKRRNPMPAELKPLAFPIDSLVPDPLNARVHGARNLETITKSLQDFGWRAVVIARKSDRVILAGNARIECARALGWTEAPVLFVTDNEARSMAYAIADNRTADLAEFDPEKLLANLGALEDSNMLELTGFNFEEFRDLASSELGAAVNEQARGDGAAAEEPADGDDDSDQLPPLPDEPTAKRGDVWKCGDHLVLCGDSFSDGAAKWIGRGKVNAVVTDPPYAIYGSSSGIGTDIADDKMVRPFFKSVGRLLDGALVKFGHAYVFTDWRSWSALWDGVRGTRMSVRNMLVWEKAGGLGTNYAMTHELIAFLHLLPQVKAMSRKETGVRPVHQPNVLKFNRPTGDDRPHNASKPVGLLRQLIENSTDEGDLVLEPFGGGGSTLIACELTGRRCLLIEMEPQWVDVIVARWERTTGQKAVRQKSTVDA